MRLALSELEWERKGCRMNRITAFPVLLNFSLMLAPERKPWVSGWPGEAWGTGVSRCLGGASDWRFVDDVVLGLESTPEVGLKGS